MLDSLPDEAYFQLLTGQANCDLDENERTDCNGHKVYAVSPCDHGTFLCGHHLGVVEDWISQGAYPLCDQCAHETDITSLTYYLIGMVMQ